MPSSRNVTDVVLLTGLTAEDGADAVEGSSTGLLSLLGWVRRELPGHVNGAVLWKALRDKCTRQHQFMSLALSVSQEWVSQVAINESHCNVIVAVIAAAAAAAAVM